MLRRHSWSSHLVVSFILFWWTCNSVCGFSWTQNTASVQQNQIDLPPTQIQSINNEPTTKNSIHLLSLSFSESPFVKRVWKWKDSVLGDGRDFFIPKPKTLTALNEFVVENVDMIQECSVLSNCARFELLLVVKTGDKECESSSASTIEHAVSRCILAQVQSHSSSKERLFDAMFHFDRPQAIDKNALLDSDSTNVCLDWTHLEGVEAVCRHLCLIAAGMALRPNRPNRPVPFRPFSSRDAHILLQLKRTSEVCVYKSIAHSLLDNERLTFLFPLVFF